MNKEEALKDLENHVTDLIGKFIEKCNKTNPGNMKTSSYAMTQPKLIEEYFDNKLDAFIVGVNLGRLKL